MVAILEITEWVKSLSYRCRGQGWRNASDCGCPSFDLCFAKRIAIIVSVPDPDTVSKRTPVVIYFSSIKRKLAIKRVAIDEPAIIISIAVMQYLCFMSAVFCKLMGFISFNEFFAMCIASIQIERKPIIIVIHATMLPSTAKLEYSFGQG